MQTSTEIDKIAAALVKAQGELKHALKDSTNPHFKSKYADLGSVWAAVKPALMKHELAALQDCGALDGAVSVGTRLIHSSGQWLAFDPVCIPLTKRDAQGVGSALTYARRYSLSAALGVVADEDDDGNAASQANGNGVADAQSITQPPKSNPGISKARTWAHECVRDMNAQEDGEHLMEYLNQNKAALTRLCRDFGSLWLNQEGHGLRSEAIKTATILQCRPELDMFISQIERLAKETAQPQAAE